MKTCSYCGAEYPAETTECPIDHTPLFPPPATPATAPPTAADSPCSEFEFAPLTEAQMRQDLVTLARCGTLVAADLMVSRLRAAGIEAFIPDQSVVLAMGFNLNAVGYVRVQVSPADYEEAKAIVSDRSDV